MIDTTGANLDFFISGGYSPEWGPGDTIIYYTHQFDDHLRIRNLKTGHEWILSDSTEDRRANYNEAADVVYFDRYNRRTAPYYDIFALDPASSQITKIIRGESPWSAGNPPHVAFEWWVYPTASSYYEALFVSNTIDQSIDTIPIRGDRLDNPVLSPNLNTLYYEEMRKGHPPRLMAYDRPTGRRQVVANVGKEPHLENTGVYLYFVAPDAANVERIWKWNSQSGERKQVSF